MPKPKFHKLLMSEGTTTFRLLGYNVIVDRFGEPYLKIVFPDMGRHEHTYRRVMTGTPENMPLDNEVNAMPPGMTEMTYHYRSGVRHYKAGGQTLLETRGLPMFPTDGMIHILRFVVFDMAGFVPYNRSPTSLDIHTASPFDGAGRVFNIYVLRNPGEIEVNQTDPLIDMRAVYTTTGFKDPELCLMIVDASYREPTGLNGWQFFTYDDPTAPSMPPDSSQSPAALSPASPCQSPAAQGPSRQCDGC